MWKQVLSQKTSWFFVVLFNENEIAVWEFARIDFFSESFFPWNFSVKLYMSLYFLSESLFRETFPSSYWCLFLINSLCFFVVNQLFFHDLITWLRSGGARCSFSPETLFFYWRKIFQQLFNSRLSWKILQWLFNSRNSRKIHFTVSYNVIKTFHIIFSES